MPAQCSSVRLLEHGFKWTFWLHLALYMPRFRLEHASAWETDSFLSAEPQWLAIYFAFIAMSLMSMDADEAGRAGLSLENATDLVRNWYDASLFFLDEADFLRTPDLRSTQAIAILLGLAKNVGDFGIQPLLQVTGIRIAQILGMDCEPPRVSEDPTTQEISRRIWWTLVICEWLCIPSRRPSIHEADFNVWVPSPLSDDDDSDAHPATRGLRLIDYHHAMIGLARTVYRFRAEMAAFKGYEGGDALDAIVLKADEALANIIAGLPSPFLDLSGREAAASNNGEYPPWVLSQQTGLSLSFLYYRMSINRSLQHRWASSDLLLARSKAVCLDSANAIVALMNDHNLTVSRYWQWPATSNLFSAALTLATEAKLLLDRDAAEEYISRVRVCFSVLERVKGHSALAARALDELSVFCIDLL
ncbi:C6 zinc finger domain-containing protein [Aspergillus ustus]|uniref:C6 zinc finger domain-containing protein n=1 Tax=Aspergillus ustus TaxID=40382 RepID=A0A0C1E646_ASPUT|nr:C6 zinc finger domain-containing protein [Aspergillus ustus]